MLSRFRAWLAEGRQYNKDNIRTWEGPSTPGADGFTPFQHETERRVLEVLSDCGVEPSVHERAGTEERFIRITLPSIDASVWIYLDGAEISGSDLDYRLERWDARTPDEHYSRFSASLRELLEKAS